MSRTPQYTALPRCRASGFTLIEILLVIAVIAILASITFGVSRGIQSAQNRARAKAELAVLSQSIEQFKLRKGDFPWTDGGGDPGETLLQALLGWKEFRRAGDEASFDDIGTVPAGGPKAFIDTAQFKAGDPGDLSQELPADNETRPAGLVFLDPWDNPYIYEYKDSEAWENFGYVLYSAGPDGEHTPVGADGVVSRAVREADSNLDNIYPGE